MTPERRDDPNDEALVMRTVRIFLGTLSGLAMLVCAVIGVALLFDSCTR